MREQLAALLKHVNEMADHVRNAQIDIDWLREHLALMRAGVQGVVDEQYKRDAKQDQLLVLTATLVERVRWLAYLVVVPSAVVLVFGGIGIARQILALLREQPLAFLLK